MLTRTVPTLQGIPLAPANVSIDYDYRLPADQRRAGGDFCAGSRHVDGRVWSVLGDVSAKGARRVALARSLAGAFKVCSLTERQPSSVLRYLNDILVSELTCETNNEYFATALVCCFHPTEGFVEFATAGSEAALISSQSGSWAQSSTRDLMLAPLREREVGYASVARAVDQSIGRGGSPRAQTVLANVDRLNDALYEDDATLIVARATAL